MPKDDTVFKRLWQSGLNAHFCGVTWKGDEELGVPDYYRNVRRPQAASMPPSRKPPWPATRKRA